MRSVSAKEFKTYRQVTKKAVGWVTRGNAADPITVSFRYFNYQLGGTPYERKERVAHGIVACERCHYSNCIRFSFPRSSLLGLEIFFHFLLPPLFGFNASFKKCLGFQFPQKRYSVSCFAIITLSYPIPVILGHRVSPWKHVSIGWSHEARFL